MRIPEIAIPQAHFQPPATGARAKTLGGLRLRLSAPVPEMQPPLIPDVSTFIRRLVAAADARLEPDEDDRAHAKEFPIPSTTTRTAGRNLAERILRACADRGLGAFVPRFGAAGDGGVALHWRTSRLELLMVIPPEASHSPTYFGETAVGTSIKGSLASCGSVGFLAQWLAENELPG